MSSADITAGKPGPASDGRNQHHLRVLLIEPWFGGSHQGWAEGYTSASAHEVDLIGLPGALWRWRLRGGAVALAERIDRWIASHGQPDALLISGLVDVAHLLALVRRRLDPSVAVVIYQHESQLVYPRHSSQSAKQGAVDEAAMHNWLSWCVADRVLFNSAFHRDAVIDELGPFLDRMPDDSHRATLDRIVESFGVLPVGVDIASLLNMSLDDREGVSDGGNSGRDVGGRGPVIVWPHRWEDDKNPAVFVRALDKLVEAGANFRLVLGGEDPAGRSDKARSARQSAEHRFAEHLMAIGPFDTTSYRRLLGQADIVVSCADHEFFGVGVVEAIAAGCVPLVPDALSYPGLIPPPWHDVALYERGRFGAALRAAVEGHEARRLACDGLAGAMMAFDWSTVGPQLDLTLAQVVAALAGKSSHRP